MTEQDERELNLVIEACRLQYDENLNIKTSISRSIEFYQYAEKWLKEQGCEVSVLTLDLPSIKWESESKRVEFYLKWI